MDYIQAVKMFVYTERTRDWNLHLYCIFKMLNLFATTEHLHYVKSTDVLPVNVRVTTQLPEITLAVYQTWLLSD